MDMDKKTMFYCIIPMAAAAALLLALPVAMSNPKDFAILGYGLPVLFVLCPALHILMMLRGHKH